MVVIYDVISLILNDDKAAALVGHDRVHLLLLPLVLLTTPVMSVVLLRT